MIEKIIQSKNLNLLLTILLLALWLRLINLNQSLWLDEAAQALESVRPFNQQWQIPYDFHPPLYHYLLHWWMDLGLSEWVMRLSSVLPGVATVFVVWLISKRTGNTGGLAALLVAIAPYLIYYSQELRMYSLATFWSALLIYALLSKRWWLHTLAALGGVYTLYLFPLMFIAEGLYIFFHERKWLKMWLISMVITFIGFAPWLPYLREQIQNGLQLPQIWPQWRYLSSIGFWKTIPLTFAKFSLGRITFDNNFLYGGLVGLAAVIFSIPLLAPLRMNLKDEDSNIWLIRYWFFVPLLLAWVISIWIPINGPWRLLFTLPALYLLIEYGVKQIRDLRIRRFIICGVVGLSLLGVALYHGNVNFHREDWKTAVKTIYTLSLQNQAAVAFAFPEPFAPYRWYAPSLKNAVAVTKDLRVDNLQELQDERLRDESVIYYFEYLSGLSDPDKFIPQWFERQGYKIQQTYNFRGVGFVYEYRL